MLDLEKGQPGVKEELIKYHKENLRHYRAELKGWRESQLGGGTHNAEKERRILEHRELVEFHRGAVEWLLED